MRYIKLGIFIAITFANVVFAEDRIPVGFSMNFHQADVICIGDFISSDSEDSKGFVEIHYIFASTLPYESLRHRIKLSSHSNIFNNIRRGLKEPFLLFMSYEEDANVFSLIAPSLYLGDFDEHQSVSGAKLNISLEEKNRSYAVQNLYHLSSLHELLKQLKVYSAIQCFEDNILKEIIDIEKSGFIFRAAKSLLYLRGAYGSRKYTSTNRSFESGYFEKVKKSVELLDLRSREVYRPIN